MGFFLDLPGKAACFSMRCQFGCRIERGGSVGCTCPPGLRLAANNKTCEGKIHSSLYRCSYLNRKLIRSHTEQPFNFNVASSHPDSPNVWPVDGYFELPHTGSCWLHWCALALFAGFENALCQFIRTNQSFQPLKGSCMAIPMHVMLSCRQ